MWSKSSFHVLFALGLAATIAAGQITPVIRGPNWVCLGVSPALGACPSSSECAPGNLLATYCEGSINPATVFLSGLDNECCASYPPRECGLRRYCATGNLVIVETAGFMVALHCPEEAPDRNGVTVP